MEHVSIADEVGCQFVCLFGAGALPDLPFEPLPPAMVPELRARLDRRSHGQQRRVLSADRRRRRRVLSPCRRARRADRRPPPRHGHRRHVRNRGPPRTWRGCATWRRYRMDVGLEVHALYPGVTSLESSGSAQPPGGRRTPGSRRSAASVAAAAPRTTSPRSRELSGYAQICDGPDPAVTSDYIEEVFERMVQARACSRWPRFSTRCPPRRPSTSRCRRCRRRERRRRPGAGTAGGNGARVLLDRPSPPAEPRASGRFGRRLHGRCGGRRRVGGKLNRPPTSLFMPFVIRSPKNGATPSGCAI